MVRGFGIAAGTERALTEQTAQLAEALGYATIWTNDTPPVSDGLETLANMARVTSSIRLGIGVMPVDSRSPEAIAEEVRDRQIPLERVVLGIGAGFSPSPLSAVRSAVSVLRRLLPPESNLGVAAMGPRMCALAGEVADLVLINWMNPDRIRWARQIVEGHGRSPEIACYVRAAVGIGALERIQEETQRYAALPHYRRHLDAMSPGDRATGVALSQEADARKQLEPYQQVLDEVIVRALPRPEAPEEVVDILRLAAP